MGLASRMVVDYLKQAISNFYCPSCGEWSRISEVWKFQPSITEIQCPKCNVAFEVSVEFTEVKNEGVI